MRIAEYWHAHLRHAAVREAKSMDAPRFQYGQLSRTNSMQSGMTIRLTDTRRRLDGRGADRNETKQPWKLICLQLSQDPTVTLVVPMLLSLDP